MKSISKPFCILGLYIRCSDKNDVQTQNKNEKENETFKTVSENFNGIINQST